MSVFIILTGRVFSDRKPTTYDSSRHQGRPNSLAQSELGQGGGIWMNLPEGVYGMIHPVIGSTWDLICNKSAIVM